MRYATVTEIREHALTGLYGRVFPVGERDAVTDALEAIARACDCHGYLWANQDLTERDPGTLECPIPDVYAASTNR